MTASVRTFLEAEVKCFLCADVSGLIRVERGGQSPIATFKAVGSETEISVRTRTQLRCPRCSGPTFFDEWEQRREYAKLDFLEDRPRRGRPPKRLVEQRGVA